MKTLKPDTYVRLAGWHHSTYAKFHTVRAYMEKSAAEYVAAGLGDKYWTTPAEAFAKAERLGHCTAFATYTGAMLVNDPSGKWHAAELAKAQSAAVLTGGEIVAVEGEPETYRVVVAFGCEMRPKFSDPIKFVKQ